MVRMIRQHVATFAAGRGYAAALRMGKTLVEQATLPLFYHDTLYYKRLELTFVLFELQADFWLSLAEQCQRRPREASP